MKRIVTYCLIYILTGISCKQEYTCYAHYSDMYGGALAFEGYDTAELHQVRLQSFVKGSGFNNILGDTIVTVDSFEIVGPKVLPRNWILIQDSKDYKITVISTNDTYAITNIKKENSNYSWTQKGTPCPTTGTNFVPFQSIDINGIAQIPASLDGAPPYYIYLVK